MSPFDFVFALLSVITSLALTHIIGGVVGLLRSPRPGRMGVVHAMWILFALLLVIGNWAGLWLDRSREEWSSLLVAAELATMITLYAFAALVIPADHDLADLGSFHEREGRRYMIAHLVFAMIAIGRAIVETLATGEPLQIYTPAVIAVLVGIIGLTIRAKAVQFAVAAALLVLVSIFAMPLLNIGLSASR